MLRKRLYIILLIKFTSLFVLNESAQAERVYGQIEPPRFKVGRLALKYEMDRFEASDNFDAEGNRTPLPGSFSSYNAYIGAENDLSTKWSTSFGVLMGRSSSHLNGVSRSNTDLKGLQFGVSRFVLNSKKRKLDLIADFKFFLNFYNNDYGSDEVSVGDGANWFQLGLWAGTDRFEKFKLWAYGGLNHPTNGFSKNLVFLIRPEFKFWKGRLGLGLEGEIPLIDDEDTQNPTTRLRLSDEYNGGSFYYQPVNPEFVAANVWFGYEPVPLTQLKIGLGDLLYGRSTADGLRVFLALEFSFSVTRSGYSFPYVKINRKESKIQKNRGIRRLKNYKKIKK